MTDRTPDAAVERRSATVEQFVAALNECSHHSECIHVFIWDQFTLVPAAPAAEGLFSDPEILMLWRDYRGITDSGNNPFGLTFVQYVVARAQPPQPLTSNSTIGRLPAPPPAAPATFGPPADGAIQRRCWTITESDTGVSQCVLYNGHEGEHQWAAAPAVAALDEKRLARALSEKHRRPHFRIVHDRWRSGVQGSWDNEPEAQAGEEGT